MITEDYNDVSGGAYMPHAHVAYMPHPIHRCSLCYHVV